MWGTVFYWITPNTSYVVQANRSQNNRLCLQCDWQWKFMPLVLYWETTKKNSTLWVTSSTQHGVKCQSWIIVYRLKKSLPQQQTYHLPGCSFFPKWNAWSSIMSNVFFSTSADSCVVTKWVTFKTPFMTFHYSVWLIQYPYNGLYIHIIPIELGSVNPYPYHPFPLNIPVPWIYIYIMGCFFPTNQCEMIIDHISLQPVGLSHPSVNLPL